MLGGAISGGIGAIGSLAGGIMANNALTSGMTSAGNQYQAGINQLNAGNAQQRSDYQPYMQAGQQGLGNYQALLSQGNQAAQPTQSQAFSFDAYKDPSAQYQMDQSNAAINASALAKGAVGGGLGKALQANSANLAQTAYSNAYNRYLQQNSQDFGQQQQLYNNQTDNWKTQMSGWGNLANMGQSAVNSTTQAGLGYNNSVNGAYQNWGNQYLDMASAKAGNMRDTSSGVSAGLGSAAKNVWG